MITVFGSINLDLVVAVPRLPGAGETISGPDHQTFAGGKGANQALAARRAGAAVRMIGAVGTDAFSELALANMAGAGVDLSGVRSVDGSTGLAFIGVDPAGENQIIVASGANARVEAEWLKPVLTAADVLVLQGEVTFPEAAKAMRIAQEADAKVIWNPAPVPNADIRPVLDAVGTLIVNETEALELAQHLQLPPGTDVFLDHMTMADRNVVITLGAKGVLAGVGGQRFKIASPKISAVDTTGAGDAFCGAFAAALDGKADVERALKEGVAAGALACTVTGAQSSAPVKEDIAELANQLSSEHFTAC